MDSPRVPAAARPSIPRHLTSPAHQATMGPDIVQSIRFEELDKSIYSTRSDRPMMRSIIAATGCAVWLVGCFGGDTPTPGTEKASTHLQGDGAELVQGEVAAAVGATLPYVEQEAENAATNGTILASRVWRTLAYEASGRRAV